MLSLNYESINYVMTQILKLSCFSYVSISYVLAYFQLSKDNKKDLSSVLDTDNSKFE